MPMNPKLAALYGTNVSEDDVEKLAAAKLAEELADEENVEVSELTDEQAEELAKQLIADEKGKVEEPEEEEEVEAKGDEESDAAAVKEPDEKNAAAEETEKDAAAEMEKAAQEKLAEADYLGRVMAHAYVQELRKIAADEEAEKEKEAASPMVNRAAKMGRNVGGKVGDFIAKHKKGIGAAAVGAAAVGGGAAAYKKFKKNKGQEKTSAAEPSALDVLAERRALEILKANGIELQEQEPEQAEQPEAKVEETKTSASEEQMQLLARKVEERAVALLEANGYTFEPEQAEEPKAEETK